MCFVRLAHGEYGAGGTPYSIAPIACVCPLGTLMYPCERSDALTLSGRVHDTVSASPAGETEESPCTDSCVGRHIGDAYWVLWRSSRRCGRDTAGKTTRQTVEYAHFQFKRTTEAPDTWATQDSAGYINPNNPGLIPKPHHVRGAPLTEIQLPLNEIVPAD